MERAIDVVIDIHTKSEIERLLKDVEQKCQQIADLYGTQLNKQVTFTKPAFQYKEDGKKKKIK